MRSPKFALLLLLACGKKESSPAPSPSPAPTQKVGACETVDADGICSYSLLPLAGDAGAELRYQLSSACAFDGGVATSPESVRLAVPRGKGEELKAHYAPHTFEPCHCTIVRPPCAPSLAISVRVDPPPYARVER